MPIYLWACKDCSAETEIQRAMADYEKPPEQCTCGSMLFRGPLIERPKTCKGFILQEGGCRGWHFENYLGNKVIQ